MATTKERVRTDRRMFSGFNDELDATLDQLIEHLHADSRSGVLRMLIRKEAQYFHIDTRRARRTAKT